MKYNIEFFCGDCEAQGEILIEHNEYANEPTICPCCGTELDKAYIKDKLDDE